MYRLCPILCLLLLASCSRREQALSTGPDVTLTVVSRTGGGRDIRGTVRFKGTPPKPRKLDMKLDGTCLSGHEHKELYEGTFVSAPTDVEGEYLLGNVFLWLEEGPFPDLDRAPPAEAVIDQKGCRYLPRVSGVEIGQTVRILNSDQTMHNVHNRASEGGFNKIMLADAAPLVTQFEKEEVMVQLRCDVHPWMRAFIGVVPHHYHAVSQADGTFVLPALPSGTYTLRAWHELLGTSKAMPMVLTEEAREVRIDFARR